MKIADIGRKSFIFSTGSGSFHSSAEIDLVGPAIAGLRTKMYGTIVSSAQRRDEGLLWRK
jgi:hypothetical protein